MDLLNGFICYLFWKIWRGEKRCCCI